MPRKKSAPSRRTVAGEVAKQTGLKTSQEAAYLSEDENRTKRPLDDCEVDAGVHGHVFRQPFKKRRVKSIQPFAIEVKTSLIKQNELLAFVELRNVEVVAGVIEPTQAIVGVLQADGDNAPALLRVSLRAGDCTLANAVRTVVLSAPSKTTAANVVHLLQSGVLGLTFAPTSPSPVTTTATTTTFSLSHVSDGDNSGSPISTDATLPPQLYSWDGAWPRRHPMSPPPSFLASAAPDIRSQHGAPTDPAQQPTSTAGRYHHLQQQEQQEPGKGGAGFLQGDWQSAVYLLRAQERAAAGGSGSGREGQGELQPDQCGSGDGRGGGGSDGQPVGSGEEEAGGWVLRVGVPASVLSRLAVSEPEDTQHRAWQTQLLDVLAWLLPHNNNNSNPANTTTISAAAAQLEQQPKDDGDPDVGLPPGHCSSPSAPSVKQTPHGGRVSGLAAAATDDVTPSVAVFNGPASSSGCINAAGHSSPPRGAPAAAGSPTMTTAGAAAATAAPGLDVGWLYGAVKPSGHEPQWYGNPPELRPVLRPYQRRAVAWMLHREGMSYSSGGCTTSTKHAVAANAACDGECGHGLARSQPALQPPLHPLWRRLHLLSSSTAPALYVNPYSGALASSPFPPPGRISGGILADEMGLGKTVEMLALITAHRFRPETAAEAEAEQGGGGGRRTAQRPTSASRRRRPRERIDCPCGVRADDPADPEITESYDGLWVLCDGCNAWVHGGCVGLRRAPRDSWVCSRCLRARALETVSEPCGATLIVVPAAILQQWYDEIRRHVRPGALRVVMYGGQRQAGVAASGLLLAGGEGPARRGKRGVGATEDEVKGFMAGAEVDVTESLVVSASQLAAADVVLTSYDVLRRDVARQPDATSVERSMRHNKRYEVVPTPLTRLRWWRVVMDEAQMVESGTAKAAEMALKLDTVHRWCVTGTPISRGLEDLYGLMAFLRAAPWDTRTWWARCVARPVEGGAAEGRELLLRLLKPTQHTQAAAEGAEQAEGQGTRVAEQGGIDGGWVWEGEGGLLWRSAKRDVGPELGLPPQSTHVLSLRLNAVERHFYNRLHQDCAAKARSVLPPRVVAAMESGGLQGEGGQGNGEDGGRAGGGDGGGGQEACVALLGDAGIEDANVSGSGSRSGGRSGTASGQGTEPLAEELKLNSAAPVPGMRSLVDGGLECGRDEEGPEAGVGEEEAEPPNHQEGAAAAVSQQQQLQLREVQAAARQRWQRWQGLRGGEGSGGEEGTGQHQDQGGQDNSRWGEGAGVVDRAATTTRADEGSSAVLVGGGGSGGDGGSDGGRGDGGSGSGRGDGGGGRPVLSSVHASVRAAASQLDRPLAPHEARKLLGPLLKLRQACCHPQVGVGGIRSLSTAAGGPHAAAGAFSPSTRGGPHPPHGHRLAPMSMGDILEVLVSRAKVEAEEAQRQLIAALSGLAAIMVIQDDAVGAVGAYRTALRVIEEHKPDIDTDPLQRLHTLHNLSTTLATAPPSASLPRTLRDGELEAEAEAIRDKYLGQRRGKLAAEEAQYREHLAAASPFHGSTGWYVAAIDLLMREGVGQAAADHIREQLLANDTYRQKTEVNASSMAHRFSSLLGLKVLLNEALDAIEEHRARALGSLEELGAATRRPQPPPDLVEQAGQCGRCRNGAVRSPVCPHCRMDEAFIGWEVRLFALYSRALTAGGEVTAEEAARRAAMAMVRWAGRGGLKEAAGAAAEEQEQADDDAGGGRRVANVAAATTSWRQSEAEAVLRLLLRLLRQHCRRAGSQHAEAAVEAVVQEGKAHVDRLEAQRRLLVAARSLSVAQRQVLYAHDELAMATWRMRLAAPGERIAPHEANLKLHPAAVPVKNVELSTDRAVAEAELRKRMGTLRYLQKLRSVQVKQQERKQQQQPKQQQSPDSGAAVTTATDNTSYPVTTTATITAALSPCAPVSPPPPHAAHISSNILSPATSSLPPNAVTNMAAASSCCCPLLLPADSSVGAPTSQHGDSSGAGPSVAAPAVDTAMAGVAGYREADGEEEEELCPICHDPICPTSRTAGGGTNAGGGDPAVILPCGHMLHAVCSEGLVARTVAPGTAHHNKRVTCPTCRSRVHVADIAYIDTGATGVDSADMHGGAPGGGPDGAAAGAVSEGGPWSGEAGVVVRGSYGTKIEAVVRRINFVLGQDSSAKVLVFSGWADLLELVAAALYDNGVPYVVARGRGGMAAALAAFKDSPGVGDDEGPEVLEDGGVEGGEAAGADVVATLPQPLAAAASGPIHPSGCDEDNGEPLMTPNALKVRGNTTTATAAATATATTATAARISPASRQGGSAKPRVLLLQFKQGGAGLNLTEAQHVVLVEPQLDPAAEAQAVGRVHRIGQTRPTHVHRFVVGHSVEEQVYKLAAARTREMDLSAAVLLGRGGHQQRHQAPHHGGGAGVGDGSEHLTVRDVAVLLDARWGTGGPGGAGEAGGGHM